MSERLEVPHISDLNEMYVEVTPLDEPGVVSVTAQSNDGNTVVVTWDEIAQSVNVRWLDCSEELLLIERESASKVSVRQNAGKIQFMIWSSSEGMGGKIVVNVGERVTISDIMLRC